jgi:hypothetical protein
VVTPITVQMLAAIFRKSHTENRALLKSAIKDVFGIDREALYRAESGQFMMSTDTIPDLPVSRAGRTILISSSPIKAAKISENVGKLAIRIGPSGVWELLMRPTVSDGLVRITIVSKNLLHLVMLTSR